MTGWGCRGDVQENLEHRKYEFGQKRRDGFNFEYATVKVPNGLQMDRSKGESQYRFGTLREAVAVAVDLGKHQHSGSAHRLLGVPPLPGSRPATLYSMLYPCP